MKAFIPLLRIGAILFVVSVAGCVHVPTATTSEVKPLFRDALFAPPTEPIDRRAIFAVDASMRRFLAREILPQTRHQDPRLVLFKALHGKLRVKYDTEKTRTASQTFTTRKGNCLSLVIMAAAFAKQLGIRVTYEQVYDVGNWSRDASFAVLSQHVNLVLGSRAPIAGADLGKSTRMIVDFLPPRQVENAAVRAISRQTIVAMYMNNRAAEVMIGGDLDRAYWFARAALDVDPAFVVAANTLGVIYKKRGYPTAAEQALRYVLKREPGNVPALTNLSQILEAEGRTAEAHAVQKRLAEIRRHPPFYFYDRGMEALRANDYHAAARLFEKALSLRPYDVPSHFELSVVALHLGDARRARRQMQLAVKNSTTPETRAIYTAKLRQLESF
ncbi:MAG: tetratricopeptide repeat protein [Rhodanobacteraceae bacterium]